jgi:hypothetical protein
VLIRASDFVSGPAMGTVCDAVGEDHWFCWFGFAVHRHHIVVSACSQNLDCGIVPQLHTETISREELGFTLLKLR